MRIVATRAPRRPVENVIAMINVVFLLLVFFLISARITPPLPIEVQTPQAAGREADLGPDVIVISLDGTLHYQDMQNEAALLALRNRAGDTPLALRVDQKLEGAALAAHLRQINAATEAPVQLVVEP